MSFQSLVIARHSHLKWKALDPLEGVLMALCGLSIAGFTLSVFCDVVTREIGRPWLWLQLVTTGFFAWGVFIGMAVATRRLDHLNLVEITKGMSGPTAHLHGGLQPAGDPRRRHRDGGVRHPEFPARHGQLSRALADPARHLHGERAAFRRADRLFCIEQIVNGWRHGFEGPEDEDDFAGIK